MGAAATAWSGGSLAVPVVASVSAAIAAGLAARRRPHRRGARPRGLGGPGLRRAAYRVAAAVVLVLVLPVLLAVALGVELTSRGPVLLRRPRAGSGPTLAFRCTDQRGRPTRLGDVLHRSSLEDLPGLLDVVAGRAALPAPTHTRAGTTPTRRTERSRPPR